MHKSLPKPPKKTQNSKNIENYEAFHESTKSFNMQLGVAKYFFDFQILFLTPFCNQKLYCRVLSQFYAQHRTKKIKKKQNSNNIEYYEVFDKSTKCFNIQLGVENIF